MKKPVRYWKREFKSGPIIYYRTPAMQTWKSTGCSGRAAAERWVIKNVLGSGKPEEAVTLRELASPYFLWETCPHCTRLRLENKQIGQSYVEAQRSLLRRHILTDELADRLLPDIRRGDVLAFRSRLADKGMGTRTLNRTIGVLKTIYREALFSERVSRDPTEGISDIKYPVKERGCFTVEELRALFPEVPEAHPWADIMPFTAFFLAGLTGMRRGEVLGLRWRNVSLSLSTMAIVEAVNDKGESGLPKWGKSREITIPEKGVEALKDWRKVSDWTTPDDLVFSNDGKPLTPMWWRYHFKYAMDNLGIDPKRRNLSPHSFRHSANTRLTALGVSPEMIRSYMGWSTERTREPYTHLGAAETGAVAEKLNEAW